VVSHDAFLKQHHFFAGHVFAFGESRPLAIANMVLGLKEIQIRGEIRTNVDYTVDLLKVR
jgi:acetyl-CoA carboxylase/biotin carboxylase 1